MPINISDLATELIQEILQYFSPPNSNSVVEAHNWNTVPDPLSGPSLTSLRLVSRQFNHSVDRHALSKVVLDFKTRIVVDIEYQFINRLLGGYRNDVRRYARALVIKGLEQRKFQQFKTSSSNALVEAIRSFEQVSSVQLTVEDLQLAQTLLKGLRSSNLRELHLDCSMITSANSWPADFALTQFTNLQRLKIWNIRTATLYNDVIQQIRGIFTNHLPLTHLEVQDITNLNTDIPDGASDECFMKSITRGLGPGALPLDHFRLEGSELGLSALTLSFLRNLSSLDLKTVNIGMDSGGSRDIWRSLQASSIHLQRLSGPKVSPTLLTYLASYSGLTELSIHPYDTIFFLTDEDTQLRHDFLTVVLPMHKETLQVLRVQVANYGHPDDWSLQLEHVPYISACVGLRELGVFILPANIQSADFMKDIIVSVFNNILHLETLRINDFIPLAMDNYLPLGALQSQLIGTVSSLNRAMMNIDPATSFARVLKPHSCEIISRDVRFRPREYGRDRGRSSTGRWKSSIADWIANMTLVERGRLDDRDDVYHRNFRLS